MLSRFRTARDQIQGRLEVLDAIRCATDAR